MNKQSNNTIQAFWVMLGSLSSFALTIVSAAILSRYFSKTEYGTYRQILYVYNTLLVIFSAGLPQVFSYFLPRYSITQGHDIISKISKALFLAGLMFSIFLFLCSDLISVLLRNPELSIGLKYFSPIPMMLLPTLGIEGIFSTYKKSIFIAIYNTLTRILMLLLIVMPVILFKGSYLYAIYGWLVVSLISLFIAIYFKQIPFKGIDLIPSRLSFKEIFTYSLPLVTAGLAGIAIKSADQFYISHFFGIEVFADFSNGFIELPFVSMITSATSTILMPIFSKLIHESNISEIERLWKNALIKSAALIYPMVAFFILNARDIVVILYSKSYETSSIYFQIAMFSNFFNIIIFAPILLSLGKSKFYATLHLILAICAWGGEYWLVTLFHSPLSVAIFSVSLGVIKILVFIKYVGSIMNLNLRSLVPLNKIFPMLIHSLIISLFAKLIIAIFCSNLSIFVSLLFNLFCFVFILFLTSKFINIDYISSFRPIINKYLTKTSTAGIKGH